MKNNVAIRTVLQMYVRDELSDLTKLFLCHMEFVIMSFDRSLLIMWTGHIQVV